MVVIDLGSAFSPVTLAEAKAFARIDHEDEDDTLALLLKAASEAVESELGLALSQRQFRMIVERRPFGGILTVRKPPAVSVDNVLAYGYEGDEIAFDPEETAAISPDRSSVRLQGEVWAHGANGVDVTITAGLAPEAVSAEIRHAILLAATSWFEMRLVGDLEAARLLPNPARRLLRPLRRIGI